MTRPGDRRPGVLSAAERLRRTVGFLLVGVALLGGYAWLIGVDALRGALSGVAPRRLASLLLAGTVPVLLWGIGLHLVLGRLGQARGLLTSVLLFAAAGFLNTVTPFGQIGGDPPAAVLIDRAIGTDFETALAAIGTTNAVNRLASLFLGLLGVSYLGSRLAIGRALEMAALAVVAVAAAVLLGAGLAWRSRRTLVRRAGGLLARPLGSLDHLPRVTPPSRARLQQRGIRFVEAIELVASAPGRLALVFGLGLAGQLAVAATLWVALAAVGAAPSFAILVLVIPVATLAGAAPTPGGLGGTAALLTGMLVATTGIAPAVAGAAAVLYRAGTFWVPALGGGVATAWYATRRPRPPDDRPGESGTSPSQPRTGAVDADVAGGVSPVPVLLVAVTVALVVFVVVIVHRRRLLVEPENPVVHVTRDAALVVLSFGATWVALRQVPDRPGH